MDKRGVSTIFAIFSILAGIVILFSATTIAKNIATGEDIKQAFFAKDMALIIDTLHALPGDVKMSYHPENFTTDINLEITESGSVKAKPTYGQQQIFSFRPGLPELTAEEFTLEKQKPNIIDVEKTGSNINVEKQVLNG